MRTKRYIQEGSERWIRWAEARMAALEALRAKLDLYKLARAWRPDTSTLVWVMVTRDGAILRITGQEGKLAFGLDGAFLGLSVTYTGRNELATVEQYQTLSPPASTGAYPWSKDGRAYLGDTLSDLTLFRGDEEMLTGLPYAASLDMSIFSTSTSATIAGDASRVMLLCSHVPPASGGSPSDVSMARFLPYVPATQTEPHRYDEVDVGPPPVEDLSAFMSYDAGRASFYVTLDSLWYGAPLRVRTKQVRFAQYPNYYRSDEVYVGTYQTLVKGITTQSTAQSRSWELDVATSWVLWRWRWDEAAQAGAWTQVFSRETPQFKYTVVDQTFLFGATATGIAGAAAVDGVLTYGITPHGGASRQDVDWIEPWFRTDGTMEVARHESLAASASQTVMAGHVVEDTGVPPYDPVVTITRYDALTFDDASPQRVLLSEAEFLTGAGDAESPGDRITTLRHLGVGRRGLVEGVGGLRWVLPDGSTMTGVSTVSKDADIAYASATGKVWVDGVEVLSGAGTFARPSFESNAAVIGGAPPREKRLAQDPVTLAWSLEPGDYIPTQVVNPVPFEDPILFAFRPAFTFPTVL